MSIASEITRISTNVSDAYSAANAKGATMPVSQNSDNLATTILSIPQSGGGAVIDSLSITPTTSAQTITAPTGLDGYNPITVSAVTSAIDANIVAGNIKKDISILGVTGTYEGGITPTGTLSITQNGTYDVTNYASADVSVPSSAPAYYVERTLDSNNKLVRGNGMNSFAGIDDLGEYTCAYMYAQTTLTKALVLNIDMSSLTKITGEQACYNMFYGCRTSMFSSSATSDVTVDFSNVVTISGSQACASIFDAGMKLGGKLTVDFSNLETISGSNAFNRAFANYTYNANTTQTISFPKLKTISGMSACTNMFNGNDAVVSVSFPELETISGSNAVIGMFYNAAYLDEVHFDKLSSIIKFSTSSFTSSFGNCSRLRNIYFGGLKASTFASAKDQFQYLFTTTTGSLASGGCTLHLPANFDPESSSKTFDITTLTGYPTFGGSASYIHLAYDLPATE